MTRGNRLEFELDQPDILLHGMADDAPSTVFSGRLIVNLSESIRVKGLKMVLEVNDGAMSTFHRETAPITHRWDFFTTADGKKVETWEAGHHEFPFSIVFPGNLPESLSLPYANVAYQLKATLRRTGIMPNITGKRDITVKRDLSVDGSFGTGAINVESRWREKLEFRIIGDADTFTPGDTMHAKFTFQPLVKHIHLTKIGVVLKEYVRCHTPCGDAEKTVSRVAASAETVPDDGENGNYLEEAAICDSLYQYAIPFPMCHQAVAMSPSDQEVPRYSAVPSASNSPILGHSRSSTPSPLCRSSSAPAPLGVDLTHAVEERIELKIPTELRRLQYDHISPYIEVTHKLKFSIHFKDPDNSQRTLWISVPVSVVPVINDDAHGQAGELPTYANAALDERIAVASAGPNPPTYDAVITESLSRVASRDPQPLPLGITDTIASTFSTDMPSIDISPPSDTESASGAASPAAEDYHEHSSVDISEDLLNLSTPGPTGIMYRRVSLSHRTVDDSRPPVCPDAVHSFFRQRSVVFPASAETTPVHSPHRSPIISPVSSLPILKSTDETALMLTNMRLFSSNGRTM
ncbi:hypothetical protein GGI19_001359 [Coemansia pectinata]|uniref:Arrestin C-terminal-like domain-containing protein n=1 Tax=Coemansia pectinata TaxID=1052879 RepID=A0A9W8H276_9FUNG|nr:hypothetical protein GGI19_001359 [Coemansia pectinata]